VFNWLAPRAAEFDGVTVSGGEPFQQYEPLMAFLHLLKDRTALDVFCFSGYYLAELESMFPDRLFYRYVDYLLDGRYVAELHADDNVRGSSNQTLYRLAGGRAVRYEAPATNKWSVRVGEGGEIYMAGVPKKDDLERLCSQLAGAGIRKEFK
jgi:anaerobic ribonucleoside-triphosphate reductase activating protein